MQYKTTRNTFFFLFSLFLSACGGSSSEIGAKKGDNQAPKATNVEMLGIAKIGEIITLDYIFNDPNGDMEGSSIITFRTLNKELQSGSKKTFKIPEGYEGEAIGAWVQPLDEHSLKSPKVYFASNNYLVISGGVKNNKTPSLINIRIEGKAKVGETLTLNYEFNDSDGSREGKSIIVWRTSTKLLQYGSSRNFVIPEGLDGESIEVWVKAVNEHGVESVQVYGATNNHLKILGKAAENTPPIANNIIMHGAAKVGGKLTLNYHFLDSDDDEEGYSIIVWGTPNKELQRSNSKTFVIPESYEGDTIGAWVVPVDEHGLESTQLYAASNNFLKITEVNQAPTASDIDIKGIAKIGGTLTLDYIFNDGNGDNEGNSIIVWSTPTKELQRGNSKTFVVPEGYEGDTINAWVRPVDEYGLEAIQEYAAATKNILIMNKTETFYLERISLPSPSDVPSEEMFIISKDEDWEQINNPNYRYFFVKPGDYSEAGKVSDPNKGRVRITSSGTENKPRYIILDNGNKKHPGQLDESQLAKVGFIFKGSSNWIVDRMAYWNSTDAYNPILLKESSNNIFNRLYFKNIGNGLYIYPESHNNIIQNSRFEKDDLSIRYDRAAIGLYNDYKNNISIKNTKIINNEIKNMVDGIQTIRQTPHSTPNNNYEGTIIDNNHIYINDVIYTDCIGNHDVNGSCAFAENAMDFKVGSENSANPIIVSNNKMWGFRKSDTTDNYMGDTGAVMPIHYNVNNIIINNNIGFDAPVGFSISDPKNGYAMRNSKIENNILYNIKILALFIADSDELKIKNNLFKNVGSESYQDWLQAYKNSNISFVGNKIVNSNDKTTIYKYGDYTSLDNEYYDAKPGDISDESDVFYSNDPTALYKDLVFTTDRFTNKPTKITVPKVLRPTQ